MNKAELIELVRNGENSTVEFKRDCVSGHDLAKEPVAFLNLNGGAVLLGVRNKIIPGMRAHNGTEPDLIEEESRFVVRLWKGGRWWCRPQICGVWGVAPLRLQ